MTRSTRNFYAPSGVKRSLLKIAAFSCSRAISAGAPLLDLSQRVIINTVSQKHMVYNGKLISHHGRNVTTVNPRYVLRIIEEVVTRIKHRNLFRGEKVIYASFRYESRNVILLPFRRF